jgi:predicted RNA polymerase sigma factor
VQWPRDGRPDNPRAWQITIALTLPAPGELKGRLAVVLRVLYLVFNEGYASTAGPALIRVDLAREAIRLARALHAARPDDSEAAGLLALMLLVHARHRARTAADGSLVPMAEQDRTRWDRPAIAEGVALVTAALPRGPVGPYQIQAAIAAVHDEAESAEATVAARAATNLQQQRYLSRQIARLQAR